MPKSTDSDITDGKEVECPFCGGTVVFGKMTHPQTGQLQAAVVHTIPMCPKFESNTADDFTELFVQHKDKN